MSQLQTATTVVSTVLAPAAAVALPLALVAGLDAVACRRRADHLQARGFRVALARTVFEAIVKACCLLPDLILVDSSLGDEGVGETAELLSTCPTTAHIPLVRC